MRIGSRREEVWRALSRRCGISVTVLVDAREWHCAIAHHFGHSPAALCVCVARGLGAVGGGIRSVRVPETWFLNSFVLWWVRFFFIDWNGYTDLELSGCLRQWKVVVRDLGRGLLSKTTSFL